MPHLQKVQSMKISGFNQDSEEAIGRVDVEMALGYFVTRVTFHVIDTKTSYKALLGRPWLHQPGWCLPLDINASNMSEIRKNTGCLPT